MLKDWKFLLTPALMIALAIFGGPVGAVIVVLWIAGVSWRRIA